MFSPSASPARLVLGEGSMGRVAETGEPMIIEDYHTWEGRARQYEGISIGAVLAAPLRVGSRLVGVIDVSDTRPVKRFRPTELHLLNLFAHEAAITPRFTTISIGQRAKVKGGFPTMLL